MIKLIILDVDGVMTDGRKYYDREGKSQNLKKFCDKDWTAIKRFKALGLPVIFLTGDPFNIGIATKRNIDVYVNRSDTHHIDKIQMLPSLCDEYKVEPTNIVYVGDDIFDVRLLAAVGYPFCPSDSPSRVKAIAQHLNGKGGENLIAELFEILDFAGELPEYTFHDHLEKVYEIDIKERF